MKKQQSAQLSYLNAWLCQKAMLTKILIINRIPVTVQIEALTNHFGGFQNQNPPANPSLPSPQSTL